MAKNTNKQILDQFHRHEALDRCAMLTDMVESHLLSHPFVTQMSAKQVRKHVKKSVKHLAKAYQLLGEAVFNDTH